MSGTTPCFANARYKLPLPIGRVCFTTMLFSIAIFLPVFPINVGHTKSSPYAEFRERVWELMPPHKNGWREIKEGSKEPVNIPTEIKEFQAKKAEAKEELKDDKPEITSTPTKGDEHASVEIMKEYLTEKGIKFHHMSGYDKIKNLYDANKK